ncbi:Tyrosine recombinase XerC [bioreactor metagenome]|uniref:Tyrosine recombinase XerC n=2 Tax=root TaxID=1 RepID=A0A644UF63_9ZZZZ
MFAWGRTIEARMKRKIATVPRLVEGRNKQWYVYFSVLNPMTGKMKPIKVYRGFNECTNLAQKKAWGISLVAELTEKLKAGWSPLDDKEKFIYSDQTEYLNLSKKFNKVRNSVKNTRYYISEYLDSRMVELKPKSFSTYQSKLRIFVNWLDHRNYGEFDISAINYKIIQEFFLFLIDDSNLDRRTIEKYVQILRSYFDFLIKKGKLTDNPVKEIKKPKKLKDMAARPIHDYDMKLLLTHIKEANPQLYMACMFQYYLAIRPGQELRLLKVRDIDVYNHKVVVVDETAKTNRRVIDMPVDLAELVLKYQINRYNRDFYVFSKNGIPGPEPLGHNTLRNRFNKFRDQLNLPSVYKFYSMKHSGGGKLLEAGLTMEEIRDHFGHKSIETTDHYLRRHFGNRNTRIINNFPPPI